MSETEIIGGGAVAEEAAQTKSRHPLPPHCFACGADTTGPYCAQCGQKNDDCRRSVVSLVGESAADIASLDGRLMRTLRTVTVRPGKHVREYGNGRRSPYSPPIRFFLAITLLFFTTLALTDTQLFWFKLTPVLDDEGAVTSVNADGGFLEKSGDLTYTDEEREALRRAASDNVEEEVGTTITLMWKQTSVRDIIDTLLEFSERPQVLNGALNDWIPRIMILMIPLMALLGTIWVRGRDALIYDHLLLSLNTHSIAFLILTVGLWTTAIAPPQVMPIAFFAGVPLYYFIGLKGAFGRGWIKTTLGTMTVFFWYLVVLSIALGFALLAAFSEIL